MPLASFLSELLFAGHYGIPCETERGLFGELSPVELVAVPESGSVSGRRGNDPEPRWGGGNATTMAPRAARRQRRGGDRDRPVRSSRAETLPAELGEALPKQGVVNLVEARAVVQRLESLALDPVFAAACAHGPISGPAAAVMSLFPAQVELLRLLIQRSDVS